MGSLLRVFDCIFWCEFWVGLIFGVNFKLVLFGINFGLVLFVRILDWFILV
jgi:hypothetical protein